MKTLEYHRTIVGYHGCDASTVDRVLAGKQGLAASDNPYDWLGKGIYFWEHGPARALAWARETAKTFPDKVKNPAVVGALIHLGDCFDLLDTEYTEFLRSAFPLVMAGLKRLHPTRPPPQNRGLNLRERYLDCAMINWAIPMLENERKRKFQSVRCVFSEGEPVYEGSGIQLKSHIQIAIRDSACILGFFRPASSTDS